jgi:DNA-directed RNA polymerase specialized sigma24 family protein
MGMRSTATVSAHGPAADLAAFNRLVEEYQGLIYTVAYRLLGEAGAATAATARAVAQAYQRPCPAGWPARAWLLQALLAVCGAGPAGGTGLGALPGPQRQVVALVDLAGLDYAQAAVVLGWTPAQVRTTLAAARRALMAQPGANG